MWKIDHFEQAGDDTHITSVGWYEDGKLVKRYPLSPSILIPPPGPGFGQAVQAMKQFINDLRSQPVKPDVSDIEDLLNAGG